MKREVNFYVILAVIFACALILRGAIFGVDGLFVEQGPSLGSYIDAGIVALKEDYLSFTLLVNPYAVIIVVAVLAQAFVMSLSACLAFIYPDLRDIHSRAHLQGHALIEWYKEHGINPLVVMVTPMFRIAVLIAVMLVFIRPMTNAIPFQHGIAEYLVLSLVYFPAVIPHLLMSKIPLWQDSNIIAHLLVGVICLLVAPFPVFIYFTCAALCQTGKVVALHVMETAHEANTKTTR